MKCRCDAKKREIARVNLCEIGPTSLRNLIHGCVNPRETVADPVVCEPDVDLVAAEPRLCHQLLLLCERGVRVFLVRAQPVVENTFLHLCEDGSLEGLALPLRRAAHDVRSHPDLLAARLARAAERLKLSDFDFDAGVGERLPNAREHGLGRGLAWFTLEKRGENESHRFDK